MLQTYARIRLGVRPEEARTYNTTDRVLLTFDDFGSAKTIRAILRLLKQEKIKAAFFLNGNWAEKHPGLVKEIVDGGHWLGNHSYSHPHLRPLSDQQIRDEIQKGVKTNLLRPPYGDYDSRVRDIAHELGFKISFWTIDSWDWKGISANEIQQIVAPRLHKGACILLHLNAPHTLEALPGLIDSIRQRGFELCRDGDELNLS